MFYYDENKMNDILSLVNKNIMQMSSMEDGYLDNMKPITRSGIYGNGIEMIDSQIVSIKDGLNDFKSITTNNSNALQELEKRLVIEVEDIPLPKDFDADDTGLETNVEKVSLSKRDGKHITSENSTDEESYNDKYNVDNKKISKLKVESLDDKELGDYLKTNIEVLKKLRKEELKDITFDDKYNIKNEKLSKLNYNELQDAKIDDNFRVKMEKLSKLNYEELNDRELEDYLHTNKITISDITKYISLLENDLGDKDEDKS